MQPTRIQLHSDKPLTDMAVAYLQDNKSFIAASAIPVKAVSRQSDLYYIFDSAAFMSDDARKRAPGTESVGGGFSMSTDSYRADVFALHKDIAMEDLINADDAVRLDNAAVNYLGAALRIRRERLLADAVFSTGIWGKDVTSTTQWQDVNSDPIALVRAARADVLLKTGQRIDTMICGANVVDALMVHPDIIDRIKYVSSDAVGTALIGQLLGVNLVVSEAVYNTAAEGKTLSNSFVFNPKSALLCTLNSPTLETASAVTRFAWTGAEGLPRPDGVVARRFDMPHLKSQRIEMEIAEAFKVTGSDLGVFLSGIVA